MRVGPVRRQSLPTAVTAALRAGDKVLAYSAAGQDAWAVGTRDALILHQALTLSVRVPWEQVERADWDAESAVLTVVEIGSWGQVRPQHTLHLDDPERLLQLVRERITASVVLQRHVRVNGTRGVFVIARRAPRGDQPITWVYEFEAGVDPDDPLIREAAAQALAAAQDEVGTG